MGRSISIRSLWRHESGATMIEMAIVLPVLVLCFGGLIEMARFLQFRDKLESAGSQVTDAVNQGYDLQEEGLENLTQKALPELLMPFEQSDISTIVTMVVRPVDGVRDCKAVSLWQWRDGPAARSAVAAGAHQKAVLSDLTLTEGDYVLTVELYGTFRTMIGLGTEQWFGKAGRNYTFTYGRPRYGLFEKDPASNRVVTPKCLE